MNILCRCYLEGSSYGTPEKSDRSTSEAERCSGEISAYSPFLAQFVLWRGGQGWSGE